jgi:hypothetical protein
MKFPSSSLSLGSFLLLALALLISPRANATVGSERFVSFGNETGGVALVRDGRAAAIYVDEKEFPGVLRAAADLQADIERVTGVKPALEHAAPTSGAAIVIGSIGRGGLVDQLVAAGKLDVGGTKGKWDGYLIETVVNPFPGVSEALVIAGADKRGAIYGIYEISEQIGVSPWYWWADVPVTHRDTLIVKSGRLAQTAPVVQYRGIFLNDEAPALTGWVQEKFGKFDHTFYVHVFELILRLRGNYLWPAMWQPRAFIDDDPENARLADEMGIVMGTSHHEPLMRAHAEWDRYGKGPWDYSKNDEVLREFWRGGLERVKDKEKIISIGMRGDGDSAMSPETNTALLERIVKDQREIIHDIMQRPVEQVPQLWALYKEVQDYYEKGMRVPDDVILLWCDDNWGNIRRLPTPEEQKRSGGAGVYYHFEYVGGPRNYKWLNTVPITKVWEQMHLAWKYDANRIWIVNVGDLKPMEFPIEFFLDYAWEPARWPYEKLEDYTRTWAAREFGPQHAVEVAALIDGYTKLNSLRKPEMIAPDTLSVSNYREAERVLGEWANLVKRAEALNAQLPTEARDAFFQLVLYPVKASANIWEINVAAGRNNLYARQGRVAANAQAARVSDLFALDAKLAAEYHTLKGGKWDHMMDQVKLGYTYWQQPPAETMPAVMEVRPQRGASMGVSFEGGNAPGRQGFRRPQLPPLDSLNRNTRWIEVFSRGDTPFTYQATADKPWIKLSPATGTVNDITRLEVGADWDAAPAGESTATVTITGGDDNATIPVTLNKIATQGVRGFVETDRHVAIEAPHFARAVNANGIEWRTLENFGRTLGGVTMFPVTASTQKPGGGSPHLEYDVHLFSAGEVTVELHCAPSLDFQSGEGLQFAVSFDDETPQVVKLGTWSPQQNWEKAVADGVRRVTAKLQVAQPGHHVFKFWMVTPGVVLERVILDAGGVRPSYLGPTESPRL